MLLRRQSTLCSPESKKIVWPPMLIVPCLENLDLCKREMFQNDDHRICTLYSRKVSNLHSVQSFCVNCDYECSHFKQK